MKDETREGRTRELVERMERERGPSRLWRKLLAEYDPVFMELYHNATMHVLQDGALSRKMKEIICICGDAFQLYEPGIRIHTRNALELGATEQEIVEALEAAILPSIHYLSVPLSIIADEVKSTKGAHT